MTVSTVVDRCAALARAHGEPVAGSASRARRWLLVEQPGAWGRDALRESGLPTRVADHLDVLRRDLPARLLMLRRTSRVDSASDARGADASDARGSDGATRTSRTVFAGVSHPGGGGWLERFHLDDVSQLVDLDLSGLAVGRSVGGEPVTDPLYLICTNGKHDACCATFGLPVARAVRDLVGDRAWECSHTGGDRFAGNLVCLPDGIFYGHLDAATAIAPVQAHEAGRILPGVCRGRSSLPFPLQAAELLTRERLGLDALDALRYLGVERAGETFTVRFALVDGRELAATVQRGRDPHERLMACGGQVGAPPTYDLIRLQLEQGPSLE